MKQTVLFATLAILFASCCQQSSTEISSLPAKWIFSTDNIPFYEENWTGEDHYLGSMTGSPAKITAVRAEGKEDLAFSYRVKGNRPEVSNLTENDYILFSTPVGYIEKGSNIEIDAVIMTAPD